MSESIRFGDVPSAVSWADELLSRPDVKSQLLVRKPGGGRFSRDELMGFAHQISVFVQKAEPRRAGIAMRCIWGVPKDGDVDFLAGHLAIQAVNEFPAKGRVRERVFNLAMGVIASEVRRYRHRKPASNWELARAINIQRQSFKDGSWDLVARAMRRELDNLLRVGDLFVSSHMEEQAMLRNGG